MSEEVKLPQKKTRPKSFTLEEFADAIAKADPEAKKEFARSLGLVQAVKKTPVANKPTNEDVKRMMLAFGDASHDENFAPAPPEWVADRDKETPGFAKAWVDSWREGKTSKINNRVSEGDAEALAAAANSNADGIMV